MDYTDYEVHLYHLQWNGLALPMFLLGKMLCEPPLRAQARQLTQHNKQGEAIP